jgi:predicted GH43/DUF377 family glycosyl hydrolase
VQKPETYEITGPSDLITSHHTQISYVVYNSKIHVVDSTIESE